MDNQTDIIEIYDAEGLGNFLDQRTQHLNEAKGLGPADLLYLVYEIRQSGLRKFLSRPVHRGYFHFLYGLNVSNTRGIVDYLKNLLGNRPKNARKIVNCVFCVFDLFSKFDLRIEISANFDTKFHIVNSNNQKIQAGNIHWQGAHVSSVLRFFISDAGIGVRFLDGPNNPLAMQGFIDACMPFWDRLGYVLGDINDKNRYGENLLFPIINKYLLKRRRFASHSLIFRKLATADPLMINYIGKAGIIMNKLDEVIEMTATALTTSPYSFSFYYTQAQAYYKYGQYEACKRTCQYLIELNLETFCFWELLGYCYFKEKNYSAALLLLNNIPAYESVPNPPKVPFQEENVLIPYKIPISCAWNIWNKPSVFDFRPFEEKVKTKRDKEILKQLLELNSTKLNNCGKKMYKLLVSLERAIDWENLQKLRVKLFNPNLEENDEEDKFNMSQDLSLNESIRESPKRKRHFSFHESEAVQESQVLEEINDGSTPDITPRDYFFSNPTNHRLSHLMHPSFRNISKNLEDLVSCLKSDLKAMYEWRKNASELDIIQENKKSNYHAGLNIPYGGEVWIRRGALAERLLMPKMAEKAYRYAVDSGFSLFAWYRLMKIYVLTGNPKAVLVCIIEVLKQLTETEYSIDVKGLPPWMEIVLAKMCSECGFKQLHSLSVELNANKFPCLVHSIESLRVWKTDGTANRL